MSEVTFSSPQLEHAIRALRGIPSGVERAAVPALNRAALAAKTFGVRKLLATYTAKSANIGRTIRVQKATRTSLAAGFTSRGVRLPMTSFQVRPGRRTTKGEAFTVAIRRGAGAKVARGFLNVARGRLAVLQREGSQRYPLRGLAGPAVPQMFAESGVVGEIEARAYEVLGRRFDHEIGRVLAMRAGR